MTPARTVPCPTRGTTFREMPTPAEILQVRLEAGPALPRQWFPGPAQGRIHLPDHLARVSSSRGAGEKPHCPTTAAVIPW